VFSAGADIGDFAAANKGGAPRGPRNSSRWIGGLGRIEKPVIVAVQGAAVGIGTTMLMHCDLICMAEEASLRTPFVNLALVPEASSSYLIPSRIGWSRAYQMFTLGEPIPAKTCVEWGLAHVCVPRAKLRETALALAKKLADKPVGSLDARDRGREGRSRTRAWRLRGTALVEGSRRGIQGVRREAPAGFPQGRLSRFNENGEQGSGCLLSASGCALLAIPPNSLLAVRPPQFGAGTSMPRAA
jgi:enoyl-CoA hydratase/carnithine racemase